MATNYNISLKRYNGVDYDTLLPKSTMSTTVTLTANGWLNNSQTVLISSSIGVTATSLVLVSPNPSDFSIYGDYGIYCSAQGTNSLTFTCSGPPSDDIVVNIIRLT